MSSHARCVLDRISTFQNGFVSVRTHRLPPLPLFSLSSQPFKPKMPAFCDCPLVCEDATNTHCVVCGFMIPEPLADDAADRVHLIETTLTREAVLAHGIAPEHWDDADHAKLHAAALKWKLPDVNPHETLLDHSKFHVFTVVFGKFRDEYGDLLNGTTIDPKPIHVMYKKYVSLGAVEFHKYLGKELQFKMFCERFYDTLREMYNIDSVGMRESFEKMREKKQSFYEYEIELTKRRKR